MAGTEKKKDIYTYRAPWTAYTMSWCSKPGPENLFKIAVGSYKEEYSNRMSIIQLKESANSSKDEVDRKFVKLCEVEHPYPATKIMWAPASLSTGTDTGQPGSSSERDLIASTGDYLRIWNVSGNKSEMSSVLHNNKNSEYCSPLTSFDWNDEDPTIVGTCSIDTTCTIWDINAKEAKTQLIAHDREVYDIAFACGTNVFGTVGADLSYSQGHISSRGHLRGSNASTSNNVGSPKLS